MKTKVSEWGNSHGIRLSSPVMDHLNIGPGDEIDIKLTDKGIEIIKQDRSVDYVQSVIQDALHKIMEATDPVSQVSNPYENSGVNYLVVALNPCKPVIREVPKGYANSYSTLADAKEAARQMLQTAMAETQTSLTDLRQLGIDNINYISL